MKDNAYNLSSADLMLSNRAYMDKCDEKDGVKDVLSHGRRCAVMTPKCLHAVKRKMRIA